MIQYVFGTGRMPIGDVLASEIAEKDAFMRRKPWGVVGGHHAVELPLRRAAVDARAEPARRQHGRLQAVARTRRRSASGSSSCSSRPASRRASSTSSTATARPARRWCSNPDVNVVLFTGSYDVGKRIQQVSAEHARPHRRRRDGQQERRHRLRGRPARPGRDRGDHQRVQDQRPALRLGRPHPGAREADRPLRREVRRHGEAAADRRPARRRATSPARSSTEARSRRC